jgi:hypothetical protein
MSFAKTPNVSFRRWQVGSVFPDANQGLHGGLPALSRLYEVFAKRLANKL